MLRLEGDVQCLCLFPSVLLSWNTVSVISQYSPESTSLHTSMLDLQIFTVISIFHTRVLGVSNHVHSTHCFLLSHIVNNPFSFFSWPWLFFLYQTSNSPFWKDIRELLSIQQHIWIFPVQFFPLNSSDLPTRFWTSWPSQFYLDLSSEIYNNTKLILYLNPE